jgi:hypothetical protein
LYISLYYVHVFICILQIDACCSQSAHAIRNPDASITIHTSRLYPPEAPIVLVAKDFAVALAVAVVVVEAVPIALADVGAAVAGKLESAASLV